MKIQSEWILEFITAVILFILIMISVRFGAVPMKRHTTETRKSISETKEADEDNSASDAQAVPEKYEIENFRITLQNPELPTGCEITAMTMVLNYYGFPAGKVGMAVRYLPTVSAEFYEEGGMTYGPDLRKYFVGDPADSGGYICGTEAICTAADKYLHNVGSDLKAADKTGASSEELYQWVNRDIPVAVWVTIGMEERRGVEGWYTQEGEYVDWSRNDHGAVLIGYDEQKVIIADPIDDRVEYEKKEFEKIFESRGRQCVILEES